MKFSVTSCFERTEGEETVEGKEWPSEELTTDDALLLKLGGRFLF